MFYLDKFDLTGSGSIDCGLSFLWLHGAPPVFAPTFVVLLLLRFLPEFRPRDRELRQPPVNLLHLQRVSE